MSLEEGNFVDLTLDELLFWWYLFLFALPLMHRLWGQTVFKF